LRVAVVSDVHGNLTAHDTRERLGEERLDWLRGLPAEHRAGDVAVVQAQPGDLWRAPMPDAGDDELARAYSALGATRVAYGHIHRPYVREVDRLTVANAGSAGLPFDHDPRAAYLLVDDGLAEVVRVEYDVEDEVRALRDGEHPDAERLSEMLRSGRFVRP